LRISYAKVGDRFIAEYRSQEQGNKYYYKSGQVNSTRIVTDDSGTRVYSAAFDPYGGIQKTWENTYDPKLKFSGKERDGDTGLDYFGARYYGHSSYRFISVDPVISREEAISNPQLWNLYSYCRNNPVTFMDPDGRTDININLARKYGGKTATLGEFTIQGTQIPGVTLELPWKNNAIDESCIPCGSYRAELKLFQKEGKSYYGLRLFDADTYPREGIWWHRGNIWSDTTGCTLPGSRADYKEESISGSEAKLKEMTDFIRVIQFVDSYILKEPTNIRVNVGIDKNLIGFIFKSVRF